MADGLMRQVLPQEWKSALRHIRTALERAQWPEPVPSEAVLLSWVGRIAANSFGLHIDLPAGIAAQPGSSLGACAYITSLVDRLNFRELVDSSLRLPHLAMTPPFKVHCLRFLLRPLLLD